MGLQKTKGLGGLVRKKGKHGKDLFWRKLRPSIVLGGEWHGAVADRGGGEG